MGKNEVEMTKKDFKDEHKHLIRVLLYGKRKSRVREAGDQAEELKNEK